MGVGTQCLVVVSSTAMMMQVTLKSDYPLHSDLRGVISSDWKADLSVGGG